MDLSTRYQKARYVTWITAITNAVLSVIKIAVGFTGRSHALIADGIHSLSDLLTDAMVLFAARYGSQEADDDHPYGHGRIETAASVVLSLFLGVVGTAIAIDALRTIWQQQPVQQPEIIVAIAAVMSIIANEWLFRYTLRVGEEIRSNLLIANAWHSRSDALSSLVVLIAFIASMLGLAYADAVAALLVGGMVVWSGLRLAWEGVRELVDTGVDDEVVARIERVISQVTGVVAVHQLRHRSMAGQVLVDVHIIVAPTLSVSEGHYIGEHVRIALQTQVAEVNDVTVHIDPEDDEQFAPSINLPNRAALLPELLSRWQNLPGGKELKVLQIHYLAAQLHLDIVLPQQLLQQQESDALAKLYQQAVSDLPTLAEVTIYYQ